ncbi:MAG TPA: Gfo/Idh/MocA family oxidoreductase [Chloroflexota bacterium]|nr:Gfo/Idh/MocA family oxidoreductase [Chloroflexota bacterium]
MSDTGQVIRFGIAGMGVGRSRARMALQAQGAQLTAIFDRRQDNAAKLAAEWGCDAAESFEALINRDDVDVIGIFTPSGTHADLAIQAMRAGKHAISTKPPDVSVEKVDAMASAARDLGRLLAVDFGSRYDDDVRKVKAALDAGRLGQPIFGDMRLKWWRSQAYFDGGDPPGWRGTWAMDGGGSLANQGIHDLDLLQWFMGPVKTVRARTRIFGHRIETEDACQAFLDFESGAWGLIETTTTVWVGLGRAIELHGSNGTIALYDRGIGAWHFRDESDEAEPEYGPGSAGPMTEAGVREGQAGRARWEPVLPEGRPKNVIEDVVSALTRGTPVVCPPEEGRKSVAILEAIYRSARRNGAEEPVEY